jgi:hypothetical protein
MCNHVILKVAEKTGRTITGLLTKEILHSTIPLPWILACRLGGTCQETGYSREDSFIRKLIILPLNMTEGPMKKKILTRTGSGRHQDQKKPYLFCGYH